jgi:hypothetical protein
MERKHQGIEVFGNSAEDGKYARSGCISVMIGVNSSISRGGMCSSWAGSEAHMMSAGGLS